MLLIQFHFASVALFLLGRSLANFTVAKLRLALAVQMPINFATIANWFDFFSLHLIAALWRDKHLKRNEN